MEITGPSGSLLDGNQQWDVRTGVARRQIPQNRQPADKRAEPSVRVQSLRLRTFEVARRANHPPAIESLAERLRERLGPFGLRRQLSEVVGFATPGNKSLTRVNTGIKPLRFAVNN